MPFEEFQDGRHCGNLECRNGTNLTVLNFHVSHQVSAQSDLPFESRCHFKTLVAILDIGTKRLPPTKFGLNLTYHSGALMV